MKISNTKILILLMTMALFTILAGCGTTGQEQAQDNQQADSAEEQTNTETEYPVVEENPIVTITMENEKEITIELFPNIAPNTVANFISLVEKGFYDGLIFHRVIPGFMVQGGDPDGNGMGGPGYSIAGEFESNGVANDLKHERGVLSMARSQDPDSAGSQFFIMVAESLHLDGDYAAFGQVTAGMDVVDSIVSVERDSRDKPLEDQRMEKVVVDTKGTDYPNPEVQ